MIIYFRQRRKIDKNLLQDLNNACLKHQEIEFNYNAPNTGLQKITMIADDLEFRSKKLYITGYCITYGNNSFLRVSNIQAPIIFHLNKTSVKEHVINVQYKLFGYAALNFYPNKNEKILQQDKNSLLIEYNESNNSLVETALSNVISNIKNDDLIYKRINDKSVVFGIPFNIHFIGMMNDVDRSIDAFDLAFRRRFKWNPTYCDYDVIENECKLKENEAKNYVDSCKLLNYLITGDERDKPSKDVKSSDSQKLGITFQIGHGYFLKIRTINPTKSLNKRKEILFDNYLLGTLKEYLIQNIGEGKATEDFLEKMKKSFCN